MVFRSQQRELLGSHCRTDDDALQRAVPACTKERRSIKDTHRHKLITGDPAMVWPIALIGVFGAFTLNLPVVLIGLATSELEAGAGSYGLLASVLAAGSLTGALASSTRQGAVRLRTLVATALTLSALYLLGAAAPTTAIMLVVLCAFGAVNAALLTFTQSIVLLRSPEMLRGRVMGIYLMMLLGSGALGGPVVGALTTGLGPRGALLVAGTTCALATAGIGLRLTHVGRFVSSIWQGTRSEHAPDSSPALGARPGRPGRGCVGLRSIRRAARPGRRRWARPWPDAPSRCQSALPPPVRRPPRQLQSAPPDADEEG